jgi:hypothetical protein
MRSKRLQWVCAVKGSVRAIALSLGYGVLVLRTATSDQLEAALLQALVSNSPTLIEIQTRVALFANIDPSLTTP